MANGESMADSEVARTKVTTLHMRRRQISILVNKGARSVCKRGADPARVDLEWKMSSPRKRGSTQAQPQGAREGGIAEKLRELVKNYSAQVGRLRSIYYYSTSILYISRS